MKLRLSISLFLALAPTLAFASNNPKTPGVRMRSQLVHDRTPKAHVHMQVVRH